jgi:hypothetical protein
MGLTIFGTSDFSNATWVPEKNTRGTWNLIQTCLITLGLCVYSAVHLNCFQQGCSYWIKALVRAKWLLVALLAPEFIVFNAWSQRRQAVRLTKLLNRRSGQPEHVSILKRLWKRYKPHNGPKDEEKGRDNGAVEQISPVTRSGTGLTDHHHDQNVTDDIATESMSVRARKNTVISAKVSVSGLFSTIG